MRRKIKKKLREPDIKTGLIDLILRSPEGKGDAVVVSEMPVSGSLRRADLVLANGRLHAFEIKSDVDRLVRLPGQLKVFSSYFEMVTVVTVARFADHLGETLPREIGLIVAEPREAGPRFYVRRRAKLLSLTREASLHYLNVGDLQRLARAHGLKPPPIHRAPLVRFAITLPHKVLQDAARAAIKRRYAMNHHAYVSARAAPNACSDPLTLLKRPSRSKTAVSGYAEQMDVGDVECEQCCSSGPQIFWFAPVRQLKENNKSEESRPLNWGLLGGQPPGAPTHVLRRRRT